jgi:tetratricopeptide (TPR) repeat protein
MPPGPFPADERARAEAMDQAITILQKLVEDFPAVPEYRHDLSETYALSAVPVWQTRGQANDRLLDEERLRKALEIAETLVAQRPNIPAYVVSEVHLHFRLAGCLQRRGELDAAEEHLRKARDLQSSLARSFPEITPHQVWVAVLEGALARLQRDRDQLDDARSHCEAALAVLNGLSREQRQLGYVRQVLEETCMDLGGILRRLGDEDGAAKAVRQAEKFRPNR